MNDKTSTILIGILAVLLMTGWFQPIPLSFAIAWIFIIGKYLLLGGVAVAKFAIQFGLIAGACLLIVRVSQVIAKQLMKKVI